MSIVKINAITVDESSAAELEARFAARKHAIDSQEGFEGFQLLRPVAGESRYFVVTKWADQASYDAWWQEQGRGAHASKEGEAPRRPVSNKAELLEFEVVLDSLD